MPKKIFIILFLVALVAIPFISFAQGLVPCGNPGQDPCNTCFAFKLLHNVIQYGFLYILLPATAIAFLIGGVLMLTAAGNETQVTRARSILWNTIIGILIAFASWVIVNTIISTIASGQVNGRAWYQFPGCSGSPSPIDIALNSSRRAATGLVISDNAIRALVFAEGANWYASFFDAGQQKNQSAKSANDFAGQAISLA